MPGFQAIQSYRWRWFPLTLPDMTGFDENLYGIPPARDTVLNLNNPNPPTVAALINRPVDLSDFDHVNLLADCTGLAAHVRKGFSGLLETGHEFGEIVGCCG